MGILSIAHIGVSGIRRGVNREMTAYLRATAAMAEKKT